MNIKLVSQGIAGILLAVTSLVGCTIRPGGDSPVPMGSMTVSWTIAESSSDWLCEMYDAEDIEVVVYDDYGSYETTMFAPCDSFAVWADLREGEYSADITMLDRRAYPVSETLMVEHIDVRRNADTEILIDFPLEVAW